MNSSGFKMKRPNNKYVAILLTIVGICLLCLNIVGLYTKPRNQDIYKEEFVNAPWREIKFRRAQFYDSLEYLLKNRIVLSDSIITSKLISYVNLGVADYWKDEKIDKYNLRIPPTENYLLYSLSFVFPKLKKYEFRDWKKAIERGVGLSSQHCIIIDQLMEKFNIPTEILTIKNHAVNLVCIGNEWWVADSDYGVLIPIDFNLVLKNPSLIRPYYEKAGVKGYELYFVERYYHPIKVLKSESTQDYSGNYYWFEKFVYFLKWFIPIILLMLALKALC